MKKTLLTVWTAVLLVLAMAGCSSPAKTTSAGPAQNQPTVASQSVATTPAQEQLSPKTSGSSALQLPPERGTAHGQSPQAKTTPPAPGQNPSQEQYTAAPAPLTITTKQVQQSNEAIQVDLSVPVLDGLQDSKLQQQLNNVFQQEATQFETDIETQANEDVKEAAASGYPFQQYNATTVYKVAYNQNGLLSITIDYYQFTGGAHGNTERKPYNYDLKTGQELSLQDLFKTGVNYTEILNREIAAQIRANQNGGYFTQPDLAFKTIDGNQPFYLTDDGLVIYFGQYEIAPYYVGIPEFNIPFSLLKNSIKPRFTSKTS